MKRVRAIVEKTVHAEVTVEFDETDPRYADCFVDDGVAPNMAMTSSLLSTAAHAGDWSDEWSEYRLDSEMDVEVIK